MAKLTVNNDQIENLTSWSYVKDITGRDPNAFTGGSGQVTATFLTRPYYKLFLDKDAVFEHGDEAIRARVRSVSQSSNVVSISADDSFLRLRKHMSSPAITGFNLLEILDELFKAANLEGVFEYGFDSTIPFVFGTYSFVGFTGSLYDALKSFCTANGLAFHLVGTNLIYFTDVHRVADELFLPNLTNLSESYSVVDSSRKVEINYYDHTEVVRDVVYPLDYSNVGDVIQVNAGEVVEVEYELNHALSSVNQPVCVLADQIVGTAGHYKGTNGVYSVLGGDEIGTDVSPSWWIANGGKVEIEIGATSTSIIVRVTAPYDDLYAPYSIQAEPDKEWSGLYVTGTGFIHRAETLQITTGASAESTSEDVGTQVENVYVSSAGDAYRAGYFTACAASFTVSRSLGTTIEQLPIPENALGKRIYFDGLYYRIETVNRAGDGNISLEVTPDTRASDFDVLHAGQRVSDLTNLWAGKTVLDIALTLLEGK